MVAAEQASEPRAYHGEGPVWAQSWGELRFVDMLAGDICRLDRKSGEVSRIHVGEVAAAFRPRTGGAAGGGGSGAMVVGIERGFAFVSSDGAVEARPELWSDPGIRMNEGGCDPDGRFYCGSMAYDGTPGSGTLYRLDTDGSVSTILEGVTISNGLAWSPDHAIAYYNDTATHAVDAFDYDRDTGLSGRRHIVEIPTAHGGPDGMTVDAEGNLWVALYGGSAVHCYSPGGTLQEVVEVPVPRVTAATFGGSDLEDLFITTSREGVPDGEQPLAGAVFHARPGVQGLPVLPYTG